MTRPVIHVLASVLPPPDLEDGYETERTLDQIKRGIWPREAEVVIERVLEIKQERIEE